MRHKKSILMPLSMSLVFASFLFTSKAFAQSAGTLSLTDFAVLPGDSVTVPLTIDLSGGDIGGFTVTLTYDKNVVNIVNNSDIVVNPAFTGSVVLANASPTTTTITATGAPTNALTGTVDLADITFTGTGAPGDSSIVVVTPTPGSFVDSTGAVFSPEPSEIAATATIIDITPDQFALTPVTNAPLHTVEGSNIITVTGINTTVPISIIGGVYSITPAGTTNHGAYTSDPGFVNEGDTVRVQQTSADTYSTTTTATLTIGDFFANFDVTTMAQPIIENLILQPIGTINAVVNSPVTFTAQASDTDEPDDSPFVFSLVNAPSGATIDSNTGVFTWTPTSTGTFTFDVVVTDGDISASQPVTIIATESPVIREKSGNRCGGYICKQYKEYRRHYKNDEAKEDYFAVKELRKTNYEKFKELRNVYLTYKEWSSEERSKLNLDLQTEFHLYKNYNGYHHYKELKEKIY